MSDFEKASKACDVAHQTLTTLNVLKKILPHDSKIAAIRETALDNYAAKVLALTEAL